MKIKFSALVSDMRGKLNGSVASRNRGGSYLRNKTTPVNPQTPEQQAVRSNFGNISSQWRGLEEASRENFRQFAKEMPYIDIFGDQRYLSGSQMFQRTGINRSLVGEPPLDNPEFPEAFPIFSEEISFSLISSLDGVALAFQNLPATSDEMLLLIYATPGQSAGITFAKNKLRLLGAFETGAGGSLSISTEYTSRLGAPSEGSKVFVRMALIDVVAGLTSAPFAIDTIVVDE